MVLLEGWGLSHLIHLHLKQQQCTGWARTQATSLWSSWRQGLGGTLLWPEAHIWWDHRPRLLASVGGSRVDFVGNAPHQLCAAADQLHGPPLRVVLSPAWDLELSASVYDS